MSRKLTVVGLNAANAIARAQTAADGAETDAAAAAASAATASTKATEAEAAKTGAEAARDQARDISNIDTTDDAVDAALNLPGSKSAATLSASTAQNAAPNAINLSGGNVTLTADQVRRSMVLTGSTAARTVTFPNTTAAVLVENLTTHDHTLIRSGAAVGTPLLAGDTIELRG